jgi:hypothetical protein
MKDQREDLVELTLGKALAFIQDNPVMQLKIQTLEIHEYEASRCTVRTCKVIAPDGQELLVIHTETKR